MSYALSSFASSFFLGERDAVPRSSTRPTSVLQAIVNLSQDEWGRIATDLFRVDPGYLTMESVLAMIDKTNRCRNLDNPVEVFIDPEGIFTLLVYDTEFANSLIDG